MDALSTSPAVLTRSRNSRLLNLALLGLIAASLLGAVFVIYETIDAERAEREQVRVTNEVMIELRNIYRAAVNAETGQRGYLITLDRSYLAPYRNGRAQIDPALGRLRRLIEPNGTPRQLALVEEIDLYAGQKMAELDATVGLLEDGRLLDARRKVLTDEGQEAMQSLRLAIREIELIERKLLDDATQETARAEGRTIPLLGVLAFLVLVFLVFGLRLVGRTARAEAQAEQSMALAEAHDRADLLARELNHRVKNLFAVILAIVQMSGRDTPEAKPVVESIATRIRALLTAHEVTQGALDRPVASLHALVETTLSPYRSTSQPAEIDGPEVMLPAKAVTPLGLVLHELTTNAVKYGAWAHGGTVHVSWSQDEAAIHIEWRETGVADLTEPEREGFGSLLMTSASRQLGGEINRAFAPEGVVVTITIPPHIHDGAA